LSEAALKERTAESRHLAASVERALYAALSTRNPGVRDRGVKEAAFVVLTGTSMPAILAEVSFVSSPADEKNLQSSTYRKQIAEALYKGVARYAAASSHTKLASAR
jgi:N-acetylmuramoyl-L-alanine amidase